MNNTAEFTDVRDGIYQCSQEGKIINKRTKHEVKQRCDKWGRCVVDLCKKGGGHHCVSVATIVAECFVPNPNNYRYVVHLDGDKSNNISSNLGWCHIRSKNHQPINLPPSDEREWKRFENSPYSISNLGEVRNDSQHSLVKPQWCRKDLNVVLKINGQTRKPALGHLIATYFVPNPNRHQHIIFKDGNRENCRWDNIAWNRGNPKRKKGSVGLESLTENDERVWEDIPEFPGYQCSNLGEVYNTITKTLLKKHNNTRGYHSLMMTHQDGTQKRRLVHRLVGMLFVENSDNKPDINHIDGAKPNNRFDNLEYVTKQENTDHAIETGLMKVRPVHQISKDGVVLCKFNSTLKASKFSGINYSTLREACVSGRIIGGCTWKFTETK